MRVPEGYGMRWSQDRSSLALPPKEADLTASTPLPMSETGYEGEVLLILSSFLLLLITGTEPDPDQLKKFSSPWIFRGFVEPMMENGHEVGWRH